MVDRPLHFSRFGIMITKDGGHVDQTAGRGRLKAPGCSRVELTTFCPQQPPVRGVLYERMTEAVDGLWCLAHLSQQFGRD